MRCNGKFYNCNCSPTTYSTPRLGGDTLIWNFNYGVQNYGGGACSGKKTGFWGGVGLGLGVGIGQWLMGGLNCMSNFFGGGFNNWMPSFNNFSWDNWWGGYGDGSVSTSSSSSVRHSKKTTVEEADEPVSRSTVKKDPAKDIPPEQDPNPPVKDVNPPANHSPEEMPDVKGVIAKLKQCVPIDTEYDWKEVSYVDDNGFTVSCRLDEDGNLCGQYDLIKDGVIYLTVNFDPETEDLVDYSSNEFENFKLCDNPEGYLDGGYTYTSCKSIFRNANGEVTSYQKCWCDGTHRNIHYKPNGDIEKYTDYIYYDEICREVTRDGSGKLLGYQDFQSGFVNVIAEIDGKTEIQTMTLEEFEEGKELTFGI